MPHRSTEMSLLRLGCLFVLANLCTANGEPVDTEWWKSTLVYRVSLRAYQDSDGDGHGDLQGLISRLGYIVDLGVETVCLDRIYPSAFNDTGYGVTDFENVHPNFGNLSDFDELLEEAHERGLRVILDVTASRTSDQHDWFNASVNRIEPYTDFYIWADGNSTNSTRLPPEDLDDDVRDNEGMSNWSWNDQRDQWYYHKFQESQPDLNLHDEDVRREIMLILEFWLERGVDGFRISGVPCFFEDEDGKAEENLELLYEIQAHVDNWTESTNSTSKLLVAGTCDMEVNSLCYYSGDNVSGILPLNCRFVVDFGVIEGGNASQIVAEIEEWLNLIESNTSANWVLSNNDATRIAPRVGSDRLDALHMLSLLLPRQAFTYYGDEIGMMDTPISSDGVEDVRASDEYGEDEFDTPMQWDDTNSGGFSTSNDTYRSVYGNYLDNNVAEQLLDPQSHLNVYKSLARLRKDPVFVRGDWDLEALNDDTVLVLRRSLSNYPVHVVIINFTDKELMVNVTEVYPDLDDYLDIVVTSSDDSTNRSAVPPDAIDVSPYAGIVLREREDDDGSTESYVEAETRDDEDTTIDYESTTSSNDDDYDDDDIISEEIETTIDPSDSTDTSNDPSIPATTTEEPNVTIESPDSYASSSAISDATLTTLQLLSIIGLATITVACDRAC